MMQETIQDKYIAIQRVREILDVSERHIYDLIREGRLIAIKIGSRAVRISEISLLNFIETSKINPEDYFDPDLVTNNDIQQQQVVRPNWMIKK